MKSRSGIVVSGLAAIPLSLLLAWALSMNGVGLLWQLITIGIGFCIGGYVGCLCIVAGDCR